MLKNLFRRAAKPAPVAPLSVEPMADRKGEPGTRVHSEYFIDVRADGVHWNARVYAANGAINEQSGHAPNESAAREQAIAWCNDIKTILGGV